MDQFLNDVFQSEWVIFVLPALLLIGVAEVGSRLGLRAHVADDAPKVEMGGIQGSAAS